MTRLLDVAKAAGVSRSTASNVFNNPEMVRPKLRQRVEKAARELGYNGPDPKGRLLRDGKFNAIAVMPPSQWGVVDSLRNPVFDLFLLGVGEVCDEIGANLVLVPDKAGNHGIKTALVDGFILGRVEHLAEVEAAQLRRLPFAVVDFDPGPNISSVRTDVRAGCHTVAKHLIELGHRRFGIVSFLRSPGPARLHPAGQSRDLHAAGNPSDQEKLQGYTDALAEAGLDIDDVPMIQADPWDLDAARMLLDEAPEATAILSMSVMQGIAVIEEARRRGRSVPGDLSVVGYNDIPDAERSDPPLTTVDGMVAQKGRVAAQIVFGGGPPRHEILQPQLIMRASTGPAPRSLEVD
ncbi:LacI family DNA-binding transcriptional regulator [Bauldia litoralis]|uniref:Transcriptional regulator, LacI family n=1 Tax=Bauldia litoralis TaxID=665467 RepID=A0A1G6BIH6_9HYPH|nr:LacI family DNA-binding transcriptional regulator [Bauldia litoralis]SDB20416.1 transcriptional regulator, LacI family [Bauldia litoralis]